MVTLLSALRVQNKIGRRGQLHPLTN